MTTSSDLPDLIATAVLHTHELDERASTSPLRLVRASRTLASMRSGELLRILTRDEASLREFRALATVKKFVVVSQERIDDHYVHLIAPQRDGPSDAWSHDPAPID